MSSCATCGAELTSKESIARHRGTKCHIEWLEGRVTELEAQNKAILLRLRAVEDRQETTRSNLEGILTQYTLA